MENFQHNNLKLLFVDDDKNVISGLRRMLFSQKKEWDMSFAEGAEEALSFLMHNPVDHQV